jgi:hypothetical protein
LSLKQRVQDAKLIWQATTTVAEQAQVCFGILDFGFWISISIFIILVLPVLEHEDKLILGVLLLSCVLTSLCVYARTDRYW